MIILMQNENETLWQDLLTISLLYVLVNTVGKWYD